MTDILIKTFIKKPENTNDPKVRESYGKLSSIIGIILNIFLSISKIIIGLISSSISIVADGINNLSDASSSIITFIGFKIASKPADKDHPYGHARYEYITGLIVSFLIIMLGMSLIKTSVTKVFAPEQITFSIISVIILITSILVKLWMWRFNKTTGNKINSVALLATAQDSLNDVVATTSVLISIIISEIIGINLDGYMGLAVSIFIIYSGIGLIKDTLSPLLGKAPDKELVNTIKNEISNYDESIIGMHDLIIHDYGPNRTWVTAHVEFPASQNILKSHDIIDNIENYMWDKYKIHLVIHLDPVETDNEEVNKLRENTKKIIQEIDEELSIHDFRIVSGKTHTNLIFDLVVPFGYKYKDEEIAEIVATKINKQDKHYFAVIKVDKMME